MIRRLTRTELVVDIVAASLGALITVPTSFALLGEGAVSPWLGGGLLIEVATGLVAILMWAAVAVSRLAPGLALAVAWFAALGQMGAGIAPQLFNVAVFLVLYATAAWGSRLLVGLGALSAGVGGAMAGYYIMLTSADASSPRAWLEQVLTVGTLLSIIAILGLAMSWGAGLLWRIVIRSRRIRAAQSRAEQAAAEEQERVRIARDMHDVVAHSLAVVVAQADGARYAAAADAADPDVTTRALTTIAQTARAALSDVRLLLTQLRHRQGDGPQPSLADLETLFAQVRQAGVEPRVTISPLPRSEPSAAIQLTVFRILQEALTNAIRHGAGPVDVRLSWGEGSVEAEVVNPVRSTEPAGSGHGLIGMRERAQLVGGTLTAHRSDDRFVVRALLPLGQSFGAGA